MSSSTLFKIAGGIFLLIPVGHVQMYLEVIAPGLRSLRGNPASYASQVSWNQANGYFITAALLCFKWAKTGVVPAGIERYIFYTLMLTHVTTSLMYIRKGVPGPPAVYLSASLLMGIAAAKSA